MGSFLQNIYYKYDFTSLNDKTDIILIPKVIMTNYLIRQSDNNKFSFYYNFSYLDVCPDYSDDMWFRYIAASSVNAGPLKAHGNTVWMYCECVDFISNSQIEIFSGYNDRKDRCF